MDFCDASVVDWEAVGAVGTWVVGIAAVVVAFRSNAIAVELKRAQSEREKSAARAMVIGLKLEAAHLGFRLRNFGVALGNLSEEFNDTNLDRAVASSELLEKVTLTDDPTKAALRATLPDTVGEKVSFLFALAHTVRQSVEGTSALLSTLKGGTANARGLNDIKERADAFTKVATNVDDIEATMATYLGVPRGYLG